MKKYTVFFLVIILGAGLSIYFFSPKLLDTIKNTPTPDPALSATPGQNSGLLKISDTFVISKYAQDLTRPRVIAFDPKGRIVISETSAGRIVVLDKAGEIAKPKRVILSNLKSPHGVAFYTDQKTKQTYLYVAETHQVARYLYDNASGTITNVKGQNIARLPEGGDNIIRGIAFGPNFRTQSLIDSSLNIPNNTLNKIKLYISVGSSCQACIESTWKRAAILESDPEGSFTAEFAGGLHNSLFMAFHPKTQQLWATEIGRPGLGNDLPPDEINIIKVADPHARIGARRFGWPFCYGNRVKDSTFNPAKIDRTDVPSDCGQTEAAHVELPAHSEPLGLAFINNVRWPKDFQGDLLVAYHGSSDKTRGYKIVRYDLDQKGNVVSVEDFVTGWLDGRTIQGQPVDLKFDAEGNLFISDDYAGVVYKISPQ